MDYVAVALLRNLADILSTPTKTHAKEEHMLHIKDDLNDVWIEEVGMSMSNVCKTLKNTYRNGKTTNHWNLGRY